jgi:hypothetical protein
MSATSSQRVLHRGGDTSAPNPKFVSNVPRVLTNFGIGPLVERLANPARFFFLLLSGRGPREPLSRGVYRGSDQGPG